MRRLLIALAAAVPLAATALLPTGAAAGTQDSAAAPLRCSSIPVKAPAGTSVESVSVVSREGGDVTFPAAGPLPAVEVDDVPAYCDVTVTLTHPGAGDHAKVQVWLPETGWTHRFQAVGGSAYAAGDYGPGLAGAIKNGYAAATTDAGVGTALDASWGLSADGKVNTALLANFADRSQHEMSVVGKEVIDTVYGTPASYSYWNGCSTGGRQGYMEAQRHPDDFDGILAKAPAINWDEFEVATLWPQVVMNEEHTFPAPCEFNEFNKAAVKACDRLDGAPDGLIGDPEHCTFDPRRLIGRTVECDGKKETITAADAAVARKIWDGPRTPSGRKLWTGIPVGAGFDLAGTQVDAAGNRKGAPFPVPALWVSTFVAKQPSFDASKITYEQFAQLFKQSQDEYDKVIGTDDPDLSDFRASDGKLLTWQGKADQLIPAQGTVDYRERVERALGSSSHRVDDFYRLFLAPGVAHCAGPGTTGPAPTDDLGTLTAWVEHGRAPGTLSAAFTDSTGKTATRDLCRYPLASRYDGHGDPADAASYHCGPAGH